MRLMMRNLLISPPRHQGGRTYVRTAPGGGIRLGECGGDFGRRRLGETHDGLLSGWTPDPKGRNQGGPPDLSTSALALHFAIDIFTRVGLASASQSFTEGKCVRAFTCVRAFPPQVHDRRVRTEPQSLCHSISLRPVGRPAVVFHAIGQTGVGWARTPGRSEDS